MLEIKNDRHIFITRGNMLFINLSAKNEDGSDYEFSTGEVIRFKVMAKDNVKEIFLEKDFEITENTLEKELYFSSDEMKIGEIKSKPITYWYEIELNPDTDNTMTIEGYDINKGPATLVIYPEGGDLND